MSQLRMGVPRQPFKQSSSFPAAGENDPASQLFDQFCSANTFHGIMDTFQQLCDVIGLHPVDHQIFYKQLKAKLLSWKAQSLWTKLDKRAANLEYKKGTACNKTRALVIGSGPCGLRVAIEIALLGGKAVIVEKREGFSRNNVLHLWPFLIHDLKALGAKKFFGKFCAGAIDHISIRTLQCILLKVALLVGVEVHSGVTFEGLSEPPSDQTRDKIGWRAEVTPADHPVAELVFDVCISADGKRNTMTEFKRKEFRGKLAIAITANFINRNTKAEASVEEISGVAYIFNQKFFKDLNRHAGIDLENIVYYKDETHYFVMTAKKQSLLCKGVLIQDYDDPEILLSKENVDQHALLEYARQAADMSTQHRLPNLEFAHNHYGQPDVAMFDFTSMFAAEHACCVVERQGYRLLTGLVGDTLLEPFWPTGSGCARGFLGAFDAAWMIRSWASGKMTPLEVIAERESIYQLLSQTTPENLNKNYLQYTIDPNTRYLNLNIQFYKPHQVASQYNGHDTEYLSEIVKQAVQQSQRYDSMRDSHNLLKWIQRQLESYESITKVVDLSSSWHSGMALCALIHHHRPELLDVYSLDPNRVEANNQLAFDLIEKEFDIAPIMTGLEIAQCDAPDKVAMASYLSRICSLLRKETASSTKSSEDKREAASKARIISLTKIGNRIRQRREEMERNETSSLKRFQDPINLYDVPSKRIKDLYDANTVLNTYGRFENIEMTYDDVSKYSKLQKELRLIGSGVRGQNKVSVLAKDLTSKLSGEISKPSHESAESSGKAQPADTCYFCKNRVYTVERCTAEGLLFHRGCFRCDYCGSPLRLSYYSFKATGNGEGKFYCVQHHALQRSATNSSGQVNSVSGRGVSSTKYAGLPPKVSSVTGKETTVKKTPERVEYVTESEVEESEYEQTKHNLCSVLRPSAFSDSDSSSSDEELHFSDEDASDEQPDLSWAELARKYSEQRLQTKPTRLPQKRTSSATSGSETETVEGASDADWETDSNTDKENIAEESENGQSLGSWPRGSRDEFSKHLLSLSPKQSIRHETKPSPTSVEIMRNRMAFFSTVSQPVRIDARVFLGLVPPSLEEERPTEEAHEVLLEARNQVEVDEKGYNEEKKADEVNRRAKLENGKEERPSKRYAEKKPVVQKAKKRTKRRKKDEKSRMTADVESTRLSTMHEAVPVVSISGATSSDEQDGRLEVEDKAAAEIPSIAKDSISKKPEGNSDDDDGEAKVSRGKLVEVYELKEHDMLRDKRSGEEGESSRSKSAGSQASENSQTLQYSDTDELLSPRVDLLSGEAMLDSKNEGGVDAVEGYMVEAEGGRSLDDVINGAAETVVSVGIVGTTKVSDVGANDSVKAEKLEHAEDEFEEILRIEESDRDEGIFMQDDQEKCEVQIAGRKVVYQDMRDGGSGSLPVRHKDDQVTHKDEGSEEQKLEHDYVVLEEVMGESEAGNCSLYEELVTDGSDKEYTKIQVGPLGAEKTEADRVLTQRQQRIEDVAGNSKVLVLSANEGKDVLVKQECAGSVEEDVSPVTGASFDVSRSSLKSDDLFEAGMLCVPRVALRAESESYSDDGGNTLGRPYDWANGAGASLLQENHNILQGLSGEDDDRAEGPHSSKVVPGKVTSEDELDAGDSKRHGECCVTGLQGEKQELETRTVAVEENVDLWNEVLDNLEDLEKRETWPVTSSEVTAETDVHATACRTLKLEHVPKQDLRTVPVEEMGPAWNEVLENLEVLGKSETWPVTTEEKVDETGFHLSACIASKLGIMPEGDLPLKSQTESESKDSTEGEVAFKKDPVSSKPLEMANISEGMRNAIPMQAFSAFDLQSCPAKEFSSEVLKTSIGEQSLDPLARINLLLESLSVNKGGLSEPDPVLSGSFAGHQTKQEHAWSVENESVASEDAKKERPNSLIICENDQRSDNNFRSDAVARLAQQTRLLDSSGRKTQKPSRNDLSSDSSMCNASTTSGSVEFVSSLPQESTNATEQLRTPPTDDSISDGRQGTSLAVDDGASSADQLASGSLSEDVLSLENVAEVNIEGEDLADLEVEVWPRVILENKSVGNQTLSKRLELEATDTNKESDIVNDMTEALLDTERSEPKREVQIVQVENGAGLLVTTCTGQNFDQRSISLASDSSTSSVLSPNRIMDAKRRFFFEPPQPLRIDPRKVFKDIPSAQQHIVAKEVSGEESSLISGEFDSASDNKSGVVSVLSSGSEPGVESVPPTEITNEAQRQSSAVVQRQSSVLPAEQVGTTVSEVEKKRQLPAVPSSQPPQPSLLSSTAGKGAKQTYLQKAGSSGSDKGRVQISEAAVRSKKQIFKEKKRPNSAFVVMEENWRLSKSKGSPVGLSRPVTAKPVHPQPTGQKIDSSVLGAEAGHTRMQASQSDGASAEEASPSLVQKDKDNRLKSFYQQKTKGKGSSPAVVKEVQDKKDKKKSLLSLLIPSRSLDKKEKGTKSPVLQSKVRTPGELSKPLDTSSMAVVREKTKSLPLEKKQTPPPVDLKKAVGDQSLLKGKLKSKPGRVSEEPAEVGHSIYKEMAGIMEGIKKVEKRNRDKNSIRDRIEAVAPPPAKAPNTVLLPPKADIEDFETESEFGDDRLSLRSFQSQMHLLSEEEAAKLRKRQQNAARKKQREKELKRLHAAQEIQQQLEEVEMRQREIERQGVEIEKALSREGSEHLHDETSLVQQWFDIVYERNVLMRYESELMVQARELELEDRQSRLEIQLRERIPHAESQRTESLKGEEQQILQELMEVVEQRDALVALLEEDRIRQQQYSKNLERIMVDRGFQLSPISHIHLPQALACLQEDR